MPVVAVVQLAEAGLVLLAPVALAAAVLAALLVEMESLVQPTQAAVAVADLAMLRPIQMAAQAAPVLSSSRSTSHENLSTHGH
jgi:negative regulator of sigma E activity